MAASHPTKTPVANNMNPQIQKIGERIVGSFFMVLRSLKLYDIDNAIFARPLQDFLDAVNELIQLDGTVSFLGADLTLYLNQQLLKFDRATLDNVNLLLLQMEKRGLAGFRVDSSVTMEQVQEFIKLFSPQFDDKELPQTFIQGLKIDDVRAKLRKIEEEELERLKSQKADKKRYAILLYSRLILHLRELYGKDKTSSGKGIARTIQELIDLFYGSSTLFLGLTNEEDPSEYQYYHVANTVLFALIFGEYLGLSKNQLMNLAMLAIYHDIGKLALSPQLLEKKGKLTSDEWKQIEKLPIYSAQELLKDGFSWKALENAVAIANISRTPSDEQTQDAQVATLSPVPLNSRILSLCSSFDALCTRRPYRLPFRPEDALVFMQTRMARQFDPYLLKRFVEFFRPLLINIAKRDRFKDKPPEDLRPPRKKKSLSIVQTIQKEFEEYRALRRLPAPNAEQLHRMEFLKKFIAWKLKQVANIPS